VAATAYKNDDFQPYLFRTTDYGKRWTDIGKDLPDKEFARVVRADPERRGLLYAGTERGAWFSRDDGANWMALQLDLPIVPVTDMTVKDGHLAIATQGRGFWMFDHLHILRQADDDAFGDRLRLLRPAPALRLPNRRADDPGHRGTNPPGGAVLHYWLPEKLPDDTPLELVIADGSGNVVRTFTRKTEPEEEETPPLGDDDRLLTADKGLNRFEWNLRYPSVERFKKLVLWNNSLSGPRAVPGTYTATLTTGETTATTNIVILPDPRSDASADELQRQFEFVWAVNQKLTETHRAITRLRSARSQVESIATRVTDQPEYTALAGQARAIVSQLDDIEQTLYQTRLEARQDPLNYPIRLNDKLAGVMLNASMGDHVPTAAAVAVRDELVAAIDTQLADLDDVLGEQLDAFNRQVADQGLPAIAAD
jgi:DNA-binding FrmR family transcriptional regulator